MVAHCEIDLRPGGVFETVTRSPEGEEYRHVGCYLEIVPNERLVWTSVLLPAYPPHPIFYTAVHRGHFIEAKGTKTEFVATVLHRDEEGREQHGQMEFYEG